MEGILSWPWQFQLMPKELKLLAIAGDDLQKTPRSYSITTFDSQPVSCLKPMHVHFAASTCPGFTWSDYKMAPAGCSRSAEINL